MAVMNKDGMVINFCSIAAMLEIGDVGKSLILT